MVLNILLLVVVPALLLVRLWRGTDAGRLDRAMSVVVSGAYMLFIFLVGRWDLLAYPLRWLWPLVFAGVALRALRRSVPPPRRPARPSWRRPRTVLKMLTAAFLFLLSIRAIQGRVVPREETVVELAFPLRRGTYYVGGGGSTQLVNAHQAYRPQRYALDIVRLNAWGAAARGIAPRTLARYTIYGDTVHSPCRGTVVAAVDGRPDLTPPEREVVIHLAGNHVVIRCQGVKVLLAHLRRGSVRVRPGETVAPGAPVGEVGNSGNTTQPHLHIHAERGGSETGILDGVGVPVRYDGRFLVRNSLVRR